MSPIKAAAYRERLASMAGQLRSDAMAVEALTRMPTGGQADGNLSNAPIHLADFGTDEMSHDVNSALLENQQSLLAEVLAALRRLDEGTFGLCETCGHEIAEARLDALPATPFCIECSNIEDSDLRANVSVGRPKSETETIAAAEKLITRREQTLEQTQFGDIAKTESAGDSQAAGSPGGGTAVGGLAGTNIGRGNPEGTDLEGAMGSGVPGGGDPEDLETAQAGPAGGAVGGIPAGKRAGHKPRPSRRGARRQPPQDVAE